MVGGWVKRTRAQIDELYDTTVPIVAEWHDGEHGEVTIYADGVVEATGAFPIELLAYALVDWHAHLRNAAMTVPRAPVAPPAPAVSAVSR